MHRVGRAFGEESHRQRHCELSTDPFFVEKVREIVGLYLPLPGKRRGSMRIKMSRSERIGGFENPRQVRTERRKETLDAGDSQRDESGRALGVLFPAGAPRRKVRGPKAGEESGTQGMRGAETSFEERVAVRKR